MNKKPIVVKKWTLEFDFYAELLRCYPMWVQLHNLPLSCWRIDSLSRIESAIRVPKFADECTFSQKRIQYAMLMVEADVTVPLVTEVTIDCRLQVNYSKS